MSRGPVSSKLAESRLRAAKTSTTGKSSWQHVAHTSRWAWSRRLVTSADHWPNELPPRMRARGGAALAAAAAALAAAAAALVAAARATVLVGVASAAASARRVTSGVGGAEGGAEGGASIEALDARSLSSRSRLFWLMRRKTSSSVVQVTP